MLRMDLKVLEMTPVLKSSTGSLHILKLFEFSLVFDNDELLIVDCLQKCANMWLDALAGYITRQTYVPWENYDYEESERLSLSEYRLGDLIYIWKALMFVKKMTTPSLTDHDSLSSTAKRLKDLDLHHGDTRKIILRRFIFQSRDTRTSDYLSSSETLSQSDQKSNGRPDPEER